MKGAVINYIKQTKENILFKQEIKSKLEKAQREAATNNLKRVSITDPESRYMKNKKGKIEFSYNPQVTVDKNGFILANEVCQVTFDNYQLQPQVIQTEANIGKIPEGCHWNFDNGYYGWKNIVFLKSKNIDAYIPDQELAQKGNKKHNYQDSLNYNQDRDLFTTKDGREFAFQYQFFDKIKDRFQRAYVLRENNKIVKTIKVTPAYTERKEMKIKMRTEGGREIYKIRAQTVEPVIGDLKENKGMSNFLTRSLQTVRTEFNIVSTGHNLNKIWIQKQRKKKDIGHNKNNLFLYAS